jgi:HK97 family phage major capsid protein
MKTSSQYRKDIASLMSKAGDLDAQAVTENRDLHDDEVALKNEILDTVEEYERIVASIERQERIAARLEQPEPKQTMQKRESKIEGGEPMERKQKFSTFGEQLAAVRMASVGRGADPRLYNAATGLNETVPSDGGFLVQTDFTNELLKQVWETAKVANLCRKVTISGNANGTVIPGVDETSRATGSRYGGIQGYWLAEAGTKTASRPKFRQIELKLKKLIGLCYATDEVLQDAAQLESVIREGFVSEFGFMLDDAVINGTGAGQPLGVLNAGCLAQAQGVNGQGTSAVIAENVIEMWGRLFASSRANAVWLVNQEVEMALMKMFLEGTNSDKHVYMPPGGLSQAPYATIFGRPVVPIEQAAAIGTIGDIILGDFTNGYILAEKGGIQSDTSIHVAFDTDQSVFRFVMRVDGQPVRAKALTPFKSTANATLSHFVALRSNREA